jgi:hypothetical protein
MLTLQPLSAEIVRRRPIGRDDGVRALDDASGLCRIAEVVLDCADVFELLHILWSAGCRDDRVTAIDHFDPARFAPPKYGLTRTTATPETAAHGERSYFPRELLA